MSDTGSAWLAAVGLFVVGFVVTFGLDRYHQRRGRRGR